MAVIGRGAASAKALAQPLSSSGTRAAFRHRRNLWAKLGHGHGSKTLSAVARVAEGRPLHEHITEGGPARTQILAWPGGPKKASGSVSSFLPPPLG